MEQKPIITLGEVAGNREVAPGHFQMDIGIAPDFSSPAPGQFVMIRSATRREPLLARPLSVFGYRRQPGRAILTLLYRMVGRGTALLATLGPGSPVSVLGPLGTGFAVPEGITQALLVAGGVGVAPLAYLLDWLLDSKRGRGGIHVRFYLGAKTAGQLAGLDRVQRASDLRICTEDGSRGRKGLVTEALEAEIGVADPSTTALFACGPVPMVKSLARILSDGPFFCQVSMEERMACGVGACLGCAVAVHSLDGRTVYQRVCKDGPVFGLRQVCMDR